MTVKRVRPVVFVWDGNAMIPLPRFRQQCDRQFVVDEEYPLAPLESRSRASHNHYFASVEEGWKNLPENISARFPNADTLRAWALVKTGYCTEKNFVCDSPGHASYLARNLRAYSPLSVIVVSGNVVLVYDPMSQSASAMGRDLFEASKAAVLDYIAGMIESKVADLKRAGAQHFRPEPKRKPR